MSIHNESTTDISIISSNLKNTKTNDENVVLISTGGMNPIHRSHISNLIQTKIYLEKIHHFNVIAGYISPSHDKYVQGKLGNEFIPSIHRLEMCQHAIEEENQQHWLAVDKAEAMASTFVNLNTVTLDLQNYLNEKFKLPKPIRVIYVAGLDLFNRCHGMHSLRRSHMGGVAVLFRHGENTNLIQSLINENPHKLYFVSLDEQNQSQSTDVSSTLIRKRLQTNEDCSHLTYYSVLKYLRFMQTHQKP